MLDVHALTLRSATRSAKNYLAAVALWQSLWQSLRQRGRRLPEMGSDMDDTEKTFKPPYMSFQTLWGYLDELGGKDLPPRIDRSLMSTKSGTDQANLLNAFSAFGLVGDGQRVQPPLVALTSRDAEERKAALAALVRTYYPDQVRVSEENGTEGQLSESFKESFNLQAAETRRKCMTFFLHALRTAGMQVSPHFPQTRSGSGAPGVPRPAKKAGPRKTTVKPTTLQTTTEVQTPGGDTYTVELQSGGRVTMAVSVSLWSLSKDDRTFVLSLVDALREYPQAAATDPDAAPEPAAAAAGQGG